MSRLEPCFRDTVTCLIFFLEIRKEKIDNILALVIITINSNINQFLILKEHLTNGRMICAGGASRGTISIIYLDYFANLFSIFEGVLKA
jgi:hypothetical protein